jgi:hypothetical protein
VCDKEGFEGRVGLGRQGIIIGGMMLLLGGKCFIFFLFKVTL